MADAGSLEADRHATCSGAATSCSRPDPMFQGPSDHRSLRRARRLKRDGIARPVDGPGHAGGDCGQWTGRPMRDGVAATFAVRIADVGRRLKRSRYRRAGIHAWEPTAAWISASAGPTKACVSGASAARISSAPGSSSAHPIGTERRSYSRIGITTYRVCVTSGP